MKIVTGHAKLNDQLKKLHSYWLPPSLRNSAELEFHYRGVKEKLCNTITPESYKIIVALPYIRY